MSERAELVLSLESPIDRNRHIAGLGPEDRRLLAAEAVQQRDADLLWAITAAYLSRRGRKGSNLSPNTLRQYERGVRELLLMWQHVNLLRPGEDAAANYVEDLRTGHTAPLQDAPPSAIPTVLRDPVAAGASRTAVTARRPSRSRSPPPVFFTLLSPGPGCSPARTRSKAFRWGNSAAVWNRIWPARTTVNGSLSCSCSTSSAKAMQTTGWYFCSAGTPDCVSARCSRWSGRTSTGTRRICSWMCDHSSAS